MRQLPVIGFNSGKYDLNAIKQFLIPYFLTTSKTEEQEEEDEDEDEREQEEKKKDENDGVGSMFVIKRNNTFMCLSTDQLKFLDMINYIAPGFSYDKYLKAYGCEVTKGHFPYEYMDRLERLDDTTLPPKEAFFSRLKNEGISDEDYASCQEAWRDNGMTTLRDFLVWYNNRDVVPFLQAIDRQFAFYRQRGIDMFKQGISVPGLTLLYLFNDLPEKTYFTIFNEKNKDLHDLVKDNIVGGPSIIFHRYHEKGVTTLRQNEYGEAARPCRSIVGYDANALYLWSLMQDMPMGWCTRRRVEKDFRPESAQLYRQMAGEWLTWESERTGRPIRHQINGREKRIGKHRVDGWCSETKTAYQFQGCFFHGCSCTREEVNAVNGKPMAQLLAETLKDHRLPTSLCQGRRAVGMRVERDETNPGRTKVSGCCISPTSTRAVDDDVATDPERRACRNRVRHDRVRHLRAGRIARALCRDAARVQEHQSDTRGSRSVHAPIRRRAQHNVDSEAHARG